MFKVTISFLLGIGTGTILVILPLQLGAKLIVGFIIAVIYSGGVYIVETLCQPQDSSCRHHWWN